MRSILFVTLRLCWQISSTTCLFFQYVVYLSFIFSIFMSDVKLLKPLLFRCWRIANRFKSNLCDPRNQKLIAPENKTFSPNISNFFRPTCCIRFLNQTFLSMCHCKSLADGFPQIDSLNTICNKFDFFSLKTLDTIWFATGNLLLFIFCLFRLTYCFFTCLPKN